MQYFDDYDYKAKNIFSFGFKQKFDEKILPWEVASFVNGYNTIYYKQDLLNSISSALEKGASAKDIIIFDGSLPLNKKYSELNLINEFYSAKYFYNLGKPYSLHPNKKTYQINFLYEIFSEINKLLHSEKFRPLTTNYLINALKLYESESFERSFEYIKTISIKSSEDYYKRYPQRSSERDPIDHDLIDQKLKKTLKKQSEILQKIDLIDNFSEIEVTKIIESKSKSDKDLKKEILKFSEIFQRINRPVVCVRLDNGDLRILARSLVNKEAYGSLELKLVKKNSPLEAVFTGMATAIQTFFEIKNKKEIHEIQKEILQEQLREATNNADISELKLKKEKILNEIEQSDVYSVNRINNNPHKNTLLNLYRNNQYASTQLINEHRMEFQKNSFVHIDEKV